ncbi:hypothetical protein ACWC3X_40345, partial [Streptomyces populi]
LVLLFLLTTWNCFLRDLSSQYQAVQFRGGTSRFVLELQDDSRRRTLDKAEVIRELLRLAREHEPTRKALLRRLR